MMMEFAGLPTDLKNLICEIAYGATLKTVKKDVETCVLIKKMHLHPLFLRDLVWSRRTWDYEVSPIHVFEPISAFSNKWEDVFDWQVVQEMLWRLDFRRRSVRCLFKRHEWVASFCNDWQNIAAFSDFFCFLLYTRVPCFKPVWKSVGFGSLRNYGRAFGHLTLRNLLVR